MPGFELLAREHPAFVHLPIAAALLLPLALLLKRQETARFLAWAGFLGGLPSLASGLLWARAQGFLPAGAWAPRSFGLLGVHELLAAAGLLAGAATILLLRRHKLRPALAAALLWAGLWGAAGHWGGRMVFPEEAPSEAASAVYTG